MFKRRPRRLTLARPHGAARRWSRGGPGLVRRAVRVLEVIVETARARTIVIEPADGGSLAVAAGQYLTHQFTIGGATIKRAYSLSSAAGARLAFTAKAIDGGIASQFILSQLKAGDSYHVIGPSGDFQLADADSSAPLGFVAGGSGITPIVSLIETALAQNPAREIRLVYASRNEAEVIFGARLAALAQRHPSLQVIHVLSRPFDPAASERGRLDAARVVALLQPRAGMYCYLCGPPGLMDAATTGLLGAGVPREQILRERFYAAPQAVQARPTQPQPVEFRRSGVTVTQQPGESILEAGLREGLALPYSCTVGGCGHCKQLLLGGEVALNEPNCLSADERHAGYTLACSAYALTPVTVDA